MPLILSNRTNRRNRARCRSFDAVVDGSVRSIASWSVRGDRLVLCGDIDRATLAFVRDALVQALHDRSIATIDVTRVGVFGSDAIRLFEELSLHQRYSVIGPPHVERVVRAVGCGHLLTTVDRPPEAGPRASGKRSPIVYDLIGRRPVDAPSR